MTTSFNNSIIHYTVTGKGPALVLIHGFLLSPSIWEEIIPELALKNKVVIIDLPGHGKSETIAKVHSMELMAEVINHILEELSIKSANFIGHSMGGYISLAFAEMFPNKIKSILLLNSTSKSDSTEQKKNRERAIQVIKNNSTIFIKMAISALFLEENRKKHQNLIYKFTNEALLFSKDGIIAAISGMKIRKDRTSVLKNFIGKKYIISGKEDPIIPIEKSEEAALESNATLFKVNSGHMSINENKEEITKLLQVTGLL